MGGGRQEQSVRELNLPPYTLELMLSEIRRQTSRAQSFANTTCALRISVIQAFEDVLRFFADRPNTVHLVHGDFGFDSPADSNRYTVLMDRLKEQENLLSRQ